MLYGEDNCNGTDVSFLMYNEELGSFAGDFGPDDIHDFRRSKKIFSVMLRSSYSVTLYNGEDWSGVSETFEGAYETFNDGRLVCQTLSGELAGKDINSLRITKLSQGKATGYWRGITSSETLKFEYSVGIESSDSTTTTDEATRQLEKSLALGWNASVTAGVTASVGVEAKAGVLGTGTTVSGSVEGSVSGTLGTDESSERTEAMTSLASREIGSTISHTQVTKVTTYCTPNVGDDRAAVWQWVIASEDFSVQAFTPHTICRTGDYAFYSPTCSWWDCLNTDCSECYSEEEEEETTV